MNVFCLHWFDDFSKGKMRGGQYSCSGGQFLVHLIVLEIILPGPKWWTNQLLKMAFRDTVSLPKKKSQLWPDVGARVLSGVHFFKGWEKWRETCCLRTLYIMGKRLRMSPFHTPTLSAHDITVVSISKPKLCDCNHRSFVLLCHTLWPLSPFYTSSLFST